MKFKMNCITERHPKKAHHSQHSLIFPSIQCRVINWFNNLQSPPPPTHLRENHFNKSLVWIGFSLKKALGVDFLKLKLLAHIVYSYNIKLANNYCNEKGLTLEYNACSTMIVMSFRISWFMEHEHLYCIQFNSYYL